MYNDQDRVNINKKLKNINNKDRNIHNLSLSKFKNLQNPSSNVSSQSNKPRQQKGKLSKRTPLLTTQIVNGMVISHFKGDKDD